MEKLKNFIKSYPHTSYAFITGFELVVLIVTTILKGKIKEGANECQ